MSTPTSTDAAPITIEADRPPRGLVAIIGLLGINAVAEAASALLIFSDSSFAFPDGWGLRAEVAVGALIPILTLVAAATLLAIRPGSGRMIALGVAIAMTLTVSVVQLVFWSMPAGREFLRRTASNDPANLVLAVVLVVAPILALTLLVADATSRPERLSSTMTIAAVRWIAGLGAFTLLTPTLCSMVFRAVQGWGFDIAANTSGNFFEVYGTVTLNGIPIGYEWLLPILLIVLAVRPSWWLTLTIPALGVAWFAVGSLTFLEINHRDLLALVATVIATLGWALAPVGAWLLTGHRPGVEPA